MENFNDNIMTPKRTQEVIKKTRHKWERPLYVLLTIVGFITVFVLMYNQLTGNSKDLVETVLKALQDEQIDLNGVDLAKLVTLVLAIMMGIGSIIGLIVIMIVNYYNLYAGEMSYAIRVNEVNYPEIYDKVKEYTYRLGMKKEPLVFVCQNNGVLNAFTCWVPGKNYIQLNAEIVDLAYMENKDFDTVFFVMAHEFGHAYLHHVPLIYQVLPSFVNFIPVVGKYILMPMLQRSREYSADRVGQALTGDKNTKECMMMLMAGRHGYKYVDTETYIKDVFRKQKKLERFARFVINLMASHPIMPFRIKALLDPKRKSGRIL